MLDSTVTDIAWNGNVGVANIGKNQTYARFYSAPKLMDALSRAANRPIYQDTDYVEIFIAGDKTSAPVYEATETYKRRFAQQWAAYKEGKEQDATGTPLSLLYPGDASLVLELQHHKVKTVEQLAALDPAASRIPRAGQLIETARAYLNKASNRDDELRNLQASNAALMARLEALEAHQPEPKKVGWPKGKPRKPAPDAAAGTYTGAETFSTGSQEAA